MPSLKRFAKALLLSGVVIMLAPGSANATVVEYTDRASFNAATTGLTTIDFEGLGTPPAGFILHSGGLTTSGVSFTDANGLLYTVDAAFDGAYNYGTGVVLSAQGGYPLSNSILTVTLPAGTTAVGVDLGINVPSPNTSSFIVALSTGDTFNVTGGSQIVGGIGFRFVGFTSSTPITSITFTGLATGDHTEGGFTPSYDNFSFGANATVVEYTDRASFNAATTGLTTIDFEGLGTPPAGFILHSGGLTTSGVSFTDANGLLYTVDAAFDGAYNYGTGVVLSAQGGYPLSNSILTVTLPAGTTAVGVDLGINVPSPNTSSFIVALSTGDTFNVTGGSQIVGGIGFRFVGFTSSTPITSITFTGLATGDHTEGGFVPSYDNFSFGSAAVVNIPDSTPPNVTPTVSGTLGTAGWYVGDVTVTWAIDDAESAIDSTTGCDSTTISSDTAGVTLTCSATSAGGTSTQSVTIKRDATSPTAKATAAPPPNADGWRNKDVNVSFSGMDALSGGVTCDAQVVLSAEGTNQSASGQCVDAAGNTSALAIASGINIDKTAPAIGVLSPVSGFAYDRNQSVLVDYTCSDALSDIKTCSGSIANRLSLDTSKRVNNGKFTVSATDRAGNSSKVTINYSVR